MADKGVHVSSGVGLPGVLFITFLVLKLCGVTNWSWWWVTSPLWIPIVVIVLSPAWIGAILICLAIIALPIVGIIALVIWLFYR